ncbi:zinc finger protein [Lusitaniella coriacea]|uniref:zinc finger Ran-binding domain-containing protein n=1 Tax=Lusitaniella coriacea TaxID=1983105 RepID=UPI003CE70135
MAIREGRWDCPSCSTQGNLGRDRACPNCGRPRPEGIKFYLPENAPKIENQELRAIAQSGADWICEYCGSSNRITIEQCVGCSAPRSNRTQAVKTYTPTAVPRSAEVTSPSPQKLNASNTSANQLKRNVTPSLQRVRRTPANRRKRNILISFILAVIVGLGVFLFQPRTIDTTVVGTPWERVVAIEKYIPVTESDWSVPSGGRIVSQREEIHHYDRILVGYETKTRTVSDQVQTGTETYVCGQKDLGNGFFEDKTCTRPIYETRQRTETYEDPIYREDPVYKTKYTYEIDKWVPSRKATASSNIAEQPYWPPLNLAKNERESERTEEYAVEFRDKKGKTYSIPLDRVNWQNYKPGQPHPLKVNALGKAWTLDKKE